MKKYLITILLLFNCLKVISQSYQITNNLGCPTDRSKSGIALVVEPNGNDFKFYVIKHLAGNCNTDPSDKFQTKTAWRLFDDSGTLLKTADTRANNGYSDPVFYTPTFTHSTKKFYAVIESANLRTESTVVIKYNAPTCSIQAPSSGTASSPTTSGFTASWTAVSGAVGYKILVAKFSDPDYNNAVKQLDVSGTYADITGLQANTRYKFQVGSKCSNGDIKYSPTLDDITTLNNDTGCNIQGPSSGTASSPTTSGFTASWTAVSGAVGYKILVAKFSDPDYNNAVKQLDVSGSSVDITGLQANTRYKFQVGSKCSNGDIKYSPTLDDITTLNNDTGCNIQGPSSGTASSPLISGFTASWTAVSGAVGYKILVAKFSDPDYNNAVKQLDVSGTSVDITGLQANTRYKFQVGSKCSNGDIKYSPTLDEITTLNNDTGCNIQGPSSGTASSPLISGFTASWTAVSGAVGYKILVAKFSDPDYNNAVKQLDVSDTSVDITGLQANTRYKFQVGSKCSNGDIKYSPTLDEITTLNVVVVNKPTLIAPNQNQELSFGVSSFNFSWQGNNTNATYELKIRNVTNGDNGPIIFEQNVGNVNQKNVTGLVEGNKYRWVVKAKDTNSEAESEIGYFSTEEKLNPPILILPSNNFTLEHTQKDVILNWNKNNKSTNITYFITVFDYQNGVTIIENKNIGVNVESFKLDGLKIGNQYSWQVTVTKNSQTTTSEKFIFKVKLAPPIILTPDQNKPFSKTTTEFTIKWTAVENPKNVEYNINMRDNRTSELVYNYFKTGVDKFSFTAENIKEGREYQFIIQAKNAYTFNESALHKVNIKSINNTVNAVNLSEPRNGTVYSSLPPSILLKWDNTNTTNEHKLFLRIRDVTDSEANGEMIFDNYKVSGTNFNIEGSKFKLGHRYKWNISSIPSEYEDLSPGESAPFYLVKSATYEFIFKDPVKIAEISHSAEFGKTLGGFNHLNPSNPVMVYSNGDKPEYFSNINHYMNDGYYSGKKWQCVEYVNRYYYLVYGLRLTEKFRDNADQFYDNATKLGLDYFPNNGSHRPKVGDILCFTNSTNGHIGIIKEVNSDYIILVSQNLGTLDHLNLKINFENKVLKTNAISGRIQGWLTLYPKTQKTTPNLVLNSIDGTDNLVQGSPFNFTARLTNNGNEPFKGKIVLEILDQNKQPISDLTDADLIYDLGKGAGLNLNHQKDNLQSVGIKYLQVKYYNGVSWVVIPGTENPKRIVINGKANDDVDLQLTSLLGNQELEIGKVYPITWESKGDIGGVNIYYSSDYNKTYTLITRNATNNGKFLWSLPSNMVTGTSYTIKIVSENYPALYDIGNSTFTIKANTIPAYNFISPKQSVVIKTGENYKVQWSSNLSDQRVHLYIFNAVTKPKQLIAFAAGTDVFDWKVPSDFATGAYQFQIESADNTIFKATSQTFEVRNETVQKLVLTDYNIIKKIDNFKLDVEANFKNVSDKNWTGCVYLTIHEKGSPEKYVADIADSKFIIIPVGTPYKLAKSDYKFDFLKDGTYQIHAKYSEGCQNNNFQTLVRQELVKKSNEATEIQIVVTSPKEGEVIYATAGKKYRIEWQANKPIPKPTVSLALNGKDFVPFTNGVQTTNFGFLEFNPSEISFPNGPHINAKVKVEYGNFFDESGAFTISPNANLNNIKITSPLNNSEITGSSLEVAWTANKETDKVNIYYSYDNISWTKANTAPILATLGKYTIDKLNFNSENFYLKVQDALVPNNNNTVKLKTPKQVASENSITGTLWNIIVDASNEQFFIESPNFPSSTKVSLFYKGELIATKPIADGKINFSSLDKDKIYTIVFEDIELGLSYSYSIKPAPNPIKYTFPVGLRKEIIRHIEALENYSYSTKSIVSKYLDSRYSENNTTNFDELGEEFNFVHSYELSKIRSALREKLVLKDVEINNEVEKRLFLSLQAINSYTIESANSIANTVSIVGEISKKIVSGVFSLNSSLDNFTNKGSVVNSATSLLTSGDSKFEVSPNSLGSTYFELICNSQWQKGVEKMKNIIQFQNSDQIFNIIQKGIEKAICSNSSYKLRIDNQWKNNISPSKEMFQNMLEGLINETISIVNQELVNDLYFKEYTNLVQNIIDNEIYNNYKFHKYNGSTENALRKARNLVDIDFENQRKILLCGPKIGKYCWGGLYPKIESDNSRSAKFLKASIGISADILVYTAEFLSNYKNPASITVSYFFSGASKIYTAWNDMIDLVNFTWYIEDYYPSVIKSNNVSKSIPNIVNTIFFPVDNSSARVIPNYTPMSVLLFPNPSDGIFKVAKESLDLSFKLYSKEGFEKQLKEIQSDNNFYYLNLSDYPAETYLLMISNGKETITKRIIKQ